MKINKIIYYLATGLFTLVMLFSAGMYFFNHEFIKSAFTSLGYPTYLIYPYATAKLLGLFAIWNPNFKIIKEWAYSAFFFAITLAFFAHIMVNDGGQMTAIIAMVALIVSYIFSKRI
ncbi:DoxX family protein [Maribacter sp. SA7]|uniref:DoxX family protein n=1 Tax=Maribacter zhoushanensis TaxID=3030012 RepID=UPI0023EBCEFD|nr:DoxX family protein [Maribacter zhoushanensis]MDF4202224.1 DoxX family protein [Maribacter zhoushanensis]